MLSKISVDKVFMHHFEKMLSASGGLAPRPPPGSCPWTLLGDFHPSDPLIAHPWKKNLRAPMMAMYDFQTFHTSTSPYPRHFYHDPNTNSLLQY